MADAVSPHANRMSDLEALMWTLEKDPRLSSSIASLTILDRPPDRVRLRSRLALAVQGVPRLRQRVVPALGRLAPPEWRDDPDFDLDRHLRWIALPAPGDDAQLCELAAQMSAAVYDRTRPLWEFVVIEGLRGGRAAMLQRLHHTITDGEGGVRMSAQFLDLERDATEPMVTLDPVAPPPETGSMLETAAATVAHDARRALGVVRRAGETAAGLALDPPALVRTGSDVAATVQSAARQLAVTDPAHSPLWKHRSTRRHLEILSVPFDEAKVAAATLGGSLNDFFVAGATGAAGAYHRARGVEVDELRMAMPVSTRTDRSAGGNAFSPTRVLVPAGITDPRERFAEVHARLASTKSERGLALVQGAAGILNLLPTSVLVRVALNQVETVDFTTSNVRGAPFDLYLAGARIISNHPLGPLGGTAWNLTLMSYAGSLDMGLHVDTGSVDDPGGLKAALEASFDELLEAGGQRRPRRAGSGATTRARPTKARSTKAKATRKSSKARTPAKANRATKAKKAKKATKAAAAAKKAKKGSATR
jgi:diacylglycerol O-acyltransferase / wax synthase